MSLPMAISALMAIDDGLDNAALADGLISETQASVRQVELALDDDDEEDL